MSASPTHLLLKARLDLARRELELVLGHLSDDLLDWEPREGMRTVRGQLFEIVGKEVELLAFARAKGLAEWEEVESFGKREATVEGYRAILQEIRHDTFAYLDSLSESDLGELTPFPEGWWEGLGLRELPLHEVFRNIAAHEWYHTGQLVTYLWTHGDDPYRW